jgi:hypothetical protein
VYRKATMGEQQIHPSADKSARNKFLSRGTIRDKQLQLLGER